MNDLMKLSGDKRAGKEADKKGCSYRRKEILTIDGIRSQWWWPCAVTLPQQSSRRGSQMPGTICASAETWDVAAVGNSLLTSLSPCERLCICHIYAGRRQQCRFLRGFFSQSVLVGPRKECSLESGQALFLTSASFINVQHFLHGCGSLIY